MTTAADGDDYTYERRSGVAVFNPTGSNGLEATQYNLVSVDLRTPDQKAAELALRVDNLVDALEALTQRVTMLERSLATLRLTLERTFEIRL